MNITPNFALLKPQPSKMGHSVPRKSTHDVASRSLSDFQPIQDGVKKTDALIQIRFTGKNYKRPTLVELGGYIEQFKSLPVKDKTLTLSAEHVSQYAQAWLSDFLSA